jgi:large subunit ribosomal protein L21e
MKGSHGSRRRTRGLRVGVRDKGKVKIRQYLAEYGEGDRVSISINPRFQAIPHPRFAGRTGEVAGRQGRSYFINIVDGGKAKRIIVPPEHLKPVEVGK